MQIRRIELFESPGPSGEGRARVVLRPGEMPAAVDRAEELLVAQGERLRLFQRAGELVRAVVLDDPLETGGLRRPAGTAQLVPLTGVALTEIFDRLAEWERLGKDGQPRRVDCPARIAAAYLSRVGQWKLLELRGIISAPILRPDGSVLGAPGYDGATGLFLTGGLRVEVPDRLTRADAVVALEILRTPFCEFPFVNAEAEAVFIAAILTGVQRRLLETAPLFCFDAPAPRTGKSLLAESVAILATGRCAPAMALSGEADELRKAIASILREGHSITNLDNIEHPLRSADLARALSQGEYADRVLGESRLLRLPTNVLWTATGNNLAVRGDLSVRALVCRLDARLENPESRSFRIPDLKAYLLKHRGELLGAALTVLRAYHLAGQPEQPRERWGGFDEWCREIRDPLLWLELPDPCATRRRVIADDPDREAAIALLSAWREDFGGDGRTVADGVQAGGQELRQAMLLVAPNRMRPSEVDGRRLGYWLRSWADRPVGGLCLRRGSHTHGKTLWRVETSFDGGKYPTHATHPTTRDGSDRAGGCDGCDGGDTSRQTRADFGFR